MSLSNGGTIQYSDLIGGIYSRLLELSGNIGDSYKSTVPDQLKYPYTYSNKITVQDGYTPYVVWSNSSKLSLVSESTFKSDYDTFCSTYLIDIQSRANTPITLSGAIKFLTAILCYIQCKFVTVYSHLTDRTAIFYIQSNPIDYSLISTTTPFIITDSSVDSLISGICSIAIKSLKSFSAISGYTIEQR